MQRYISFPFLQEKINTKNVRNRIKAPRKQKNRAIYFVFHTISLTFAPALRSRCLNT